ncbi:hypothetical protein DCAR_0313659 [Daucus carota subsp. sativus]|uniref:Uncharacterized protein n=1 Tax=Daucus carota subsp. sativus TaxID=79200 RepID=A0A166C515_DAUCS|nr:PREDICTED: uncharacterized protein LOC108213011 [Daucus carota subsp. sativus]XP_017240215.1 PREDICTED: uncharacterized protein LOC108213011 [Daucus carota subsp. sativus]WOG94365.1 hypothetical protein DCAR_0313659 [Daucus carota subsp. sativus]
MDDIFSHLLALTSYMTQQFTQFLEDLLFGNVNYCSRYVAVSSSGQHEHPVTSGYSPGTSFCDNCSSSSLLYVASGSPWVQEIGILNLVEPVCTICKFVESSRPYWIVEFFVKGLNLPLSGLRLSWRLALASLRSMLIYVKCAVGRIQGTISRVQKTLHGSSSDIGWLQQAPGMAPVKDGSARFMELLDCIRHGQHKLPDSFVYLLIPGLFSNHGPLYFVSAKRYFSKMGLACHIAKIHSEASVEHNAGELRQYIEELYWGSGKRVMLLGHSKGGVDAAAALSIYWTDLKEKVGGLVLVQSPYGGTPLASDVLREGQIADKETRRIMELVICKLIKGDIRALDDLTYERRKEFLMKYELPPSIPLISFHSEASTALSVIATMTQIAHAELPWLRLPGFSYDDSRDVIQSGRKVPIVVPVSAVMALCALHLQLRYGEKSDGLVTCRDAEVPGSIVVRPRRKLDHAWMVYSSWNRNLNEPDACEMCEALLTQLVELGSQIKGEEME